MSINLCTPLLCGSFHCTMLCVFTMKTGTPVELLERIKYYEKKDSWVTWLCCRNKFIYWNFTCYAVSHSWSTTSISPVRICSTIIVGLVISQLFLFFVQVTYPLDVIRLRLAVEPGYKTMSEVIQLKFDVLIIFSIYGDENHYLLSCIFAGCFKHTKRGRISIIL